METVIFDYNRTIYDPDTDKLVPGALKVLQELADRDQMTLILVSRNEPGRLDRFYDFSLGRYFHSVHWVERKTHLLFSNLVVHGQTYVVGDYLHEEIRFGNQCGYRTVWLKRGKFSTMQQESPMDEPWQTITELPELLKVMSPVNA